METKSRNLGSLLAAALLWFAPASLARADAWVYEVLTLRPEAPSYQAEAYVGALGLIARRHGGLRVDGALEPAALDGSASARVIGLWRFNDVDGLDELVADPAYRSLGGLQERTFDPSASRDLEHALAMSRAVE